VAMSPWEMLEVIVMLLGVPLVLGMWVAKQFPAFAHKVQKPMKSLLTMAAVLSTMKPFTADPSSASGFLGWRIPMAATP